MIERVENLRTQLDGLSLPHGKSPVERGIHNRVTRTRQDIAASIAECIWRRVCEGGRVEEVIRIPLAARQIYGLPQHDVRPVRCTRIREIRGEIHGIKRRPALQSNVAAKLPPAENRPQHRRRRQRVYIAGAQSESNIEEGEAALQSQVPLILSAEAFVLAGDQAIGVVNRFAPDETRQKCEPSSHAFFGLDLQRMIDGVSQMLTLKNRAEQRKRSQRLEVAGARWKILACLNVCRRIESPKPSEIRAFGSNVGKLEERVSWKLLLQTSRPLLYVGSRRVLIDPEIAREPGRTSLRETVLQ